MPACADRGTPPPSCAGSLRRSETFRGRGAGYAEPSVGGGGRPDFVAVAERRHRARPPRLSPHRHALSSPCWSSGGAALFSRQRQGAPLVGHPKPNAAGAVGDPARGEHRTRCRVRRLFVYEGVAFHNPRGAQAPRAGVSEMSSPGRRPALPGARDRASRASVAPGVRVIRPIVAGPRPRRVQTAGRAGQPPRAGSRHRGADPARRADNATVAAAVAATRMPISTHSTPSRPRLLVRRGPSQEDGHDRLANR